MPVTAYGAPRGSGTTTNIWCFASTAENVALYGGTSCTGWYAETGSSRDAALHRRRRRLHEGRPRRCAASRARRRRRRPAAAVAPAPPLAPSPPCYDAFEVRVGVKLLMPIGGVGGWHVPAESCAHFEAAPADCGVWTWRRRPR